MFGPITITEALERKLGLSRPFIRYEGEDYGIRIKSMGSDYIVFMSERISVCNGTYLTLFFWSGPLLASCQLVVDNSYDAGDMTVVECVILESSASSFFAKLEDLASGYNLTGKRSANRILCTAKASESMGLKNELRLKFMGLSCRATVKDLSEKSIKVLTSPELLLDKGGFYDFTISFSDPDIQVPVKDAFIVRKSPFSYGGFEFAEVVFSIAPSAEIRERISRIQERDFREERSIFKRR